MSPTEIEALLHQAMGLDASSIGVANIERAVTVRMAQSGARSPDEYWQRLRSSPAELQELVEAVVVPETWFFRHGEAFTELNRYALQEWFPTHQWGVLRVVSIPCSTGEEPYSIVMSLLDAGLAPERFTVEAWDISQRALARAERAIYSRNSFRSGNLDFRDRYFQPVKEGFKVSERVKSQVTFRHTNMLAPEHQANEPRYEVIFCRNVLIYFDRPTQDLALSSIRHLLFSDGVVFVGPAEALLMRGAGFAPSKASMSFAFRRSEVAVKKTITPIAPSLSPAPRTLPKPAPPKPVSTLLQPVKSAITSSPVFAVPTSSGLEAVQRLADSGLMAEAQRECESYLKSHANSTDGFYLQGVIRDALGDATGAVQSYRKVLYLDPNHGEALVHLALLAQKNGNTAEAQRLQERARRAGGKA